MVEASIDREDSVRLIPDAAPSIVQFFKMFSLGLAILIPFHFPGAISPSGLNLTGLSFSPRTSILPRIRMIIFLSGETTISVPGSTTSFSTSLTTKFSLRTTFPSHLMRASFSSEAKVSERRTKGEKRTQSDKKKRDNLRLFLFMNSLLIEGLFHLKKFNRNNRFKAKT